jgi:hypothetical protein
MTFVLNYSNMGKTDRLRVPVNCMEHLKFILKEYNRLYELKGEEGVIKIQKNLEEALEKIN